MSRRYDTRTTIFSPEGRLYQIEYAMEAIERAGTCLGILASDGVVLAAEKKNTNKLLDETVFFEKIYQLDNHMACSVAGITSDANVLTHFLRLAAQRYLLQYQEEIPCEQLVMKLCDLKQQYTQFGGKRPFGVSMLYMGWDKHYGFQLYQSEPSGNYGGWKATCIGNNHQAAVSMLKQEYKDTPTLKESLELAIKVLSKTLDSTKLSSNKGQSRLVAKLALPRQITVEIATLTRIGEGADARTVIRTLPSTEVDVLIKEHQDRVEQEKLEKAKEEKAKAEKKT